MPASKAEFLQHQQDATRLEIIQEQTFLERADELCHQASTPSVFQSTTEQQSAIEGITGFCRQSGGGTFASFNGPAGSGKSTTSRLVRESLISAGYSVGLCAPTHKACQVLADACNVNKTETATFASLLGLREKKQKDEVDFVPQPGSNPRLDENDIWLAAVSYTHLTLPTSYAV